MVYFSDTNTHNFDKVTFDDFINQFERGFAVDMHKEAWTYRPKFLVSWYTFSSKEIAAAEEKASAERSKILVPAFEPACKHLYGSPVRPLASLIAIFN